ncbi:MAG: 3-phenylpropionate MFS transporter [Emcibacteraceae bacterium]|nr:3-phenylpropionate MFS transporter [Emcibacteraceae bacterium]
MDSRSIFARLSANYTSMYIFLGVMTPFWGMWLRSKGLSASEIGILIAIPYILKIFIAPFISQLADKRDEYWRPLVICVGAGLFFTTCYFWADDFWSLLIVTVLINLTMPAVVPLLETITVSQSDKNKLDYGRIRSFGSASFIVAAIIVGWLLKSQNVDNVLWYVIASLVLLFITVLLMPRGNKKRKEIKVDQESPIKKLLSNGEFVWFLIVVGLLQVSHGVFYSMGSIYWKEMGLGEDIIGLLWAIGVIAEILFFVFCGPWISKYPIALTFAVIGLMGTLRWTVLALTISLPILFVTQLLHGLTFGASHLIAIQYISKNVKSQFAGTAQSLYSSLPLGLGMGLSTYVGGIIYEKGQGDAYLAMAFLCAVAFLMSLVRLYRRN